MTKNTTQNWFDIILDSQKQIIDSVNENTKKWSKNDQVTKVIESSSENFNKWVDFQKDIMTKATTVVDGKTVTTEDSKEFMNKWSSFYTELLNSQVEAINGLFKQNGEAFKMNFPGMENNPWMNAMNQGPMSSWTNSLTDMYKNMFSEFKGMDMNKDIFGGLFNHTQSYMKFYELWSPVMKAMETNSFDPKNLQNYFSADAFKKFMESFLHMMPADMQAKMNEGTELFKENMKKFSGQGMDMYKNFSAQMNGMTGQGNNAFAEYINMYNNMYQQFQTAIAPFSKLVTPNKYTAMAEETMEIMDLMNRYQISNAQMQFMSYNTGIKAMENMALELAKKSENGEDMSNMQDVFKMWLDTSDKFFVEYFETPEFSKLQAENSSISLKIKKAMDKQMEQMFSHLPLVNRTEMDELYQTVYDLNKKVKTLEKDLEAKKTTATPTPTAEKAPTKPVAPTNKKK